MSAPPLVRVPGFWLGAWAWDDVAAVVYVDTAPATGAIDPDFDPVEKPMPSLEDLAKQENLDGLSEEQLEAFRRRSVPSRAPHSATARR